MPKPKTARGRHIGPRSYQRHKDLIVPPALREVMDGHDDNPELFSAVMLRLTKAELLGEDATDPATAAWLVAEVRAELAEKRAGGDDPFAA